MSDNQKLGLHQSPIFRAAVVILIIAALAWTILYSKAETHPQGVVPPQAMTPSGHP